MRDPTYHSGENRSTTSDDEAQESRRQRQYEELFNKGEYSAIPEQEFLFLAWAYSGDRDWQQDGTSPTWEFCRYLCAHPKFKSLKPSTLVRKLRDFGLVEEHLEAIIAEIPRVRFAIR